MDRFVMQLSFNIGRLFLASMYLPLGVISGCPRALRHPSANAKIKVKVV